VILPSAVRASPPMASVTSVMTTLLAPQRQRSRLVCLSPAGMD
jgi:hypothetical protein